MPVRTIRIEEEPSPEDDPLIVEIVGKTTGGDPFTERFQIVDAIPYALIRDLSSTVTVNDAGEQVYGKAAVLSFLENVVVEADKPRWQALMRDPVRYVPLSYAVDVMLTVVAEKADRPTGPQSNSPGGSAVTSNGSGDGSPSPVTPAATPTDGA